MADFLSQFHHLPCGSNDGFIALLLPERDVERAIRESCPPPVVFSKRSFEE
jgi:hypothetical protein